MHRILLLLVAVAAFAALPALAREPLPDGYERLIQTKDSDVDLEGDGKERVQRHYDEAGVLDEVTYIDAQVEPALVERLSVAKESGARVRTTRKGNVLIRRETEKYSRPGQLEEREVVWSSREDGKLDRKTVLSYAKLRVRIREYTLENGAWKITRESEAPALDGERVARGGGARKAAPSTPSPELGRYLECLAADAARQGAAGDTAGCAELLSRLPREQLRLERLGLPRYTNLECAKDDVLYLPNGYRVDLRSCAREDDPKTPENESTQIVTAIRAATNSAMTDLLSCLRELNPRLARRYVTTVQERRPEIRCAGNTSRFPDREFCASEQEPACVRELTLRRATTSGFFAASRPDEIFLTGADPTVRNDVAVVDERGGNPILGSTIFHESLHAVGLSGRDLENAEHNDRPPSYGDAVYGCQALCSPSSSDQLTREGCRACATAAGNKPSGALLADCNRFPKADVLKTLVEADQITTLSNGCGESFLGASRTLKVDDDPCGKLLDTKAYQSVCMKDGLTPMSTRCVQRLRIHAAKLIRSVAKKPGAETAFEQFNEGAKFEVRDRRVRPARAVVRMAGKEARQAYDAIVLLRGFCAELAETPNLTYSRLVAIRDGYDRDVPARLSAPITDLRGRKKITYETPVLREKYDRPPKTEQEQASEVNRSRAYCDLFNRRPMANKSRWDLN